MIDTITVHVTEPLYSSIIVDLLDKYPNLEEITCSPSVYNRTSKKYIKALNDLGIEVNIERRWGAKSQSNGLEFDLLKFYNKGFSAKEIAEEFNLTLNRVYYLLNKAGATLDRRERKYDYDKVYVLNHDGFTVREISEKLDIPQRTIYYILQKNKLK